MLAASQELRRSRLLTIAAMPAARMTRSAPLLQTVLKRSCYNQGRDALQGRPLCLVSRCNGASDLCFDACAQCNIWTFCIPDTGEGCDNTCVASQFNYNPSNPTDPLRFGQSSSGCLPGNQWPKSASSPLPSICAHLRHPCLHPLWSLTSTFLPRSLHPVTVNLHRPWAGI